MSTFITLSIRFGQWKRLFFCTTLIIRLSLKCYQCYFQNCQICLQTKMHFNYNEEIKPFLVQRN